MDANVMADVYACIKAYADNVKQVEKNLHEDLICVLQKSTASGEVDQGQLDTIVSCMREVDCVDDFVLRMFEADVSCDICLSITFAFYRSGCVTPLLFCEIVKSLGQDGKKVALHSFLWRFCTAKDGSIWHNFVHQMNTSDKRFVGNMLYAHAHHFECARDDVNANYSSVELMKRLFYPFLDELLSVK